VETLNRLLIVIRETLDEWLRVRWSELYFAEKEAAVFLLVVLLAISVFMVAARRLRSRKPGRTHVSLPAVLPVMRRSYASAIRHGALIVFALGIPFFAIALAAPQTGFTREEVSYPGRRVALVIDSSNSMVMKFDAGTLKPQGGAAFYTAVAAAEYFMRVRMSGPYHDLMALIRFGNYAYVVTPFTTDYQNILLSIGLIGNPEEWGRFDDAGTTIIQAIEEGLALFKTFDFLNASGNLLVLFTDGRDDQATLNGRRLDEIMSEARKFKVPVYMIRTAFGTKFGGVKQDELWKSAVEASGGRFYVAAEEKDILEAIRDIDRLSPGKINVREYTSQEPRFSGYALIAVALWLTAGLLKVSVPYFRTFP
jgi:VWA domain-containing protein